MKQRRVCRKLLGEVLFLSSFPFSRGAKECSTRFCNLCKIELVSSRADLKPDNANLQTLANCALEVWSKKLIYKICRPLSPVISAVWTDRLNLSSRRQQGSDSRIEELGSLEEKGAALFCFVSLVVVFLGLALVITFKYTEAVFSKFVPEKDLSCFLPCFSGAVGRAFAGGEGDRASLRTCPVQGEKTKQMAADTYRALCRNTGPKQASWAAIWGPSLARQPRGVWWLGWEPVGW